MNRIWKLSQTPKNGQFYSKSRKIPTASTRLNSFWATQNMMLSLLTREVPPSRDITAELTKYQIISLRPILRRNRMRTLSLKAWCVSTGTKRSRTWPDKSIRWAVASTTTRVWCNSSLKGKIPIMEIPVIMRRKGRRWSLFCQKYELG